MNSAPVQPGEILANKYRVERILGVGGMGVVVQATHVHLDERVALKFMLPEAMANAEVAGRFLREARMAVKLKSEHVAKVMDVGTLESGSPYIVMEYLEGTDLNQLLERHGPLPFADVAEYVIQACDAIAEAHSLGIVHRDLKPANLFLTHRADGAPLVKVLDFGISKANQLGDAGGGMTKTAAMMGSPYFMSPEQMRSAKDVDARSDVWSVGVIIYQLLTARLPFESDTLGGIMAAVFTEDPRMLSTYRPDVPHAFEAIVRRCLQRDPSARAQNVGEIAMTLAPYAPARAKPIADRVVALVGAGAGQPLDADHDIAGAYPQAGGSQAPAPAVGPADPVVLGAGPTTGALTVTPIPACRKRQERARGIAAGVVAVLIAGGRGGMVGGRSAERSLGGSGAGARGRSAAPVAAAPTADPDGDRRGERPRRPPPQPPPSPRPSRRPLQDRAGRGRSRWRGRRPPPPARPVAIAPPRVRPHRTQEERPRRPQLSPGDPVKRAFLSSPRARGAPRRPRRPRAQGSSDLAAAQGLFDAAKQLVAQGKLAEACPKFLASFRFDPKPGTMVNLADCYEKNGQTASAWARYLEAATLAQRAGQAEREQYAKEHAAALEPKVARLSIAAAAAPGLEVLRDGKIDAAILGTPVPVDPGKHLIEARAPGKKTWSKDGRRPRRPRRASRSRSPPWRTLPQARLPGRSHTLLPSRPPPPRGTSLRRRAHSLASRWASRCSRPGAPASSPARSRVAWRSPSTPASPRCRTAGVCVNQDSAIAGYHVLGTVADVGLIVGGALAATGIVLVVTAPKASAAKQAWVTPVVGPGFVGVKGRF